jgi:hypothetical protein
MNDDRTNIIVSQQRRDLAFGDWASAAIFVPRRVWIGDKLLHHLLRCYFRAVLGEHRPQSRQQLYSDAWLIWSARKQILIGGHKNWRVASVPTSTITPLKLRCTCFDEARWTASIKDNSVLNVAGIHRCVSWNRGEAVSKRRPRKSRELSLTSGTARNWRLLKWRPSQEKMVRVTLLN